MSNSWNDFLTFETNFVVMPTDTNYMQPMIFGGALFSKMDLAAACCVSRILTLTECDSAVTHKFNGTFHAAAQMGDIVYIKCRIIDVRTKAITVSVEAHSQSRKLIEKKCVATAEFVFCSRKDGIFHPHNIPRSIFGDPRKIGFRP
jgi:acyl-CoA hydrolase